MTANPRSAAARRAALIRWSRADADAGRTQGRAGQAGLERKLMALIDPDGKLPPHVAAQRLDQARRAYMIGLSQARAAKRAASS